MSARFHHLFFMRPAPQADAGIHIGAMMHAMASDKSIVTAIITNNTDRGMTLDANASAWRQEGDLDVLTPSHDIRIGPASFVLAPQTKQIVRFGITAHDPLHERAYQVAFSDCDGCNLATLPVFIAPVGARASLRVCIERNSQTPRLILANVGRAHAHIREVEARADANADTPFYLLAGGQIELPLQTTVSDVRIVATDVDGVSLEHTAFLAAADAVAG